MPNATENFDSYLNSHNEKSFSLLPILAEDVETLIATLWVYKPVGPDSITTIILNKLKKLSQKHWFIFFTVLFRKILKQAKIIPIFKQEYKNYIPISLLSNIRQIIERLVYRQLYGFLELNDLLYIPISFVSIVFTQQIIH